jgi:hypothetical protein
VPVESADVQELLLELGILESILRNCSGRNLRIKLC